MASGPLDFSATLTASTKEGGYSGLGGGAAAGDGGRKTAEYFFDGVRSAVDGRAETVALSSSLAFEGARASHGMRGVSGHETESFSSDFLKCLKEVFHTNFKIGVFNPDSHPFPLPTLTRLAPPESISFQRDDELNLYTDFGPEFTRYVMGGLNFSVEPPRGVSDDETRDEFVSELIEFWSRERAAEEVPAFVAWFDTLIGQMWDRFFEFDAALGFPNLPHTLGGLKLRPAILRILPFSPEELSNNNLYALILFAFWSMMTGAISFFISGTLVADMATPVEGSFLRCFCAIAPKLIGVERIPDGMDQPVSRLTAITEGSSAFLTQMNEQLKRLASLVRNEESYLEKIQRVLSIDEDYKTETLGFAARAAINEAEKKEGTFVVKMVGLLKPTPLTTALWRTSLWDRFVSLYSQYARLMRVDKLILQRYIFLELWKSLQLEVAKESVDSDELSQELFTIAKDCGIFSEFSARVVLVVPGHIVEGQSQSDTFRSRVLALNHLQEDLLAKIESAVQVSLAETSERSADLEDETAAYQRLQEAMTDFLRVQADYALACTSDPDTAASVAPITAADKRKDIRLREHVDFNTVLSDELRQWVNEYQQLFSEHHLWNLNKDVLLAAEIKIKREQLDVLRDIFKVVKDIECSVSTVIRAYQQENPPLAVEAFDQAQQSWTKLRQDIAKFFLTPPPGVDLNRLITVYFSSVDQMQALEDRVVNMEARGSLVTAAAEPAAAAAGAGSVLSVVDRVDASVISEEKRQYYAFMRKLKLVTEDYIARLGAEKHTHGKERLVSLLRTIVDQEAVCSRSGNYSQFMAMTLPDVLNFIATGTVNRVDSGLRFFGGSGFKENSLRLCFARQFIPNFDGARSMQSVRAFAAVRKSGTEDQKRTQWEAVLNLFALPPEAVTVARLAR